MPFGSRLGPIVALVLVAACRPGPWDPIETDPAAAPFERLPYVQAVDTSGAVVLWRVGRAVRDSFRYRIGGEGEWRTAPVERIPIPEGRSPDRGATSEGPRDRRVRLRGLPPASEVEYAVLADTVALPPSAFRTAPRPGGAGPVRVLAFGDSGFGSESQVRLARLMEARGWDVAIHVGDLAYASGTERDFTLRHFGVYDALLARVPFFPTPGNHDLLTDGGRPYDRAFEWPAPRPGARYYTFRWGPVRLFALDSSSGEAGRDLRRASGEQYAWLVAALDSARREAGVRWLVAYMHHPLHSGATGFAGKGPDRRLREALVPLFERHGVDLVVSGHDHHYERSHPILSRDPVPPGCGPVYLVTGGGGASLYARGITPPYTTAAVILRAHHFLELRFEEDAVAGEAVDDRGGTLDEFRVLPFEGVAGEPPPRCS